MLGLQTLSKRIFGTQNDRKIKAVKPLVAKINALESAYEALSDAEIIEKTASFKQRIKQGETLDALLPEAFANVREAAKRALGLRAYDVQLIGGIFLHRNSIAEMKTGEGKTLVAVFPCYLNALSEQAVHVVTVNDYLARRDAEWMGKVYSALGMTTGVVVPDVDEGERINAYRADVVYATNNELGFDYLRDNMKSELSHMAQRGHYFAIVDEVDSILIDEARTPLIISGPAEDRTDLYTVVNKLIPAITQDHYTQDEKTRNVTLNDEGNEFIEAHLKTTELMPDTQSLYDPESATLVHHINQALRAHVAFKRDKDYIVRNDAVVLIDEFTGRMMEGRRLSDGLHQAIEAKEGVSIQAENVTLASVTFQNYFRLYNKLAGMTGTAQTEAEEFAEIYGLDVVSVPTNKPIARIDEHDAIYRTSAEKYRAIVAEIAKAHAKGQPILVGTTSIEKSEYLSNLLKDKKLLADLAARLRDQGETSKSDVDKAQLKEQANQLEALSKTGIKHNVLNARFHEQEAEIIADAGMPNAVTIATNMAGRGTDIQLGGNVDRLVEAAAQHAKDDADMTAIRAQVEKDVAKNKQIALDAGGLFVLATERHESRRIDNQLRGRSGRQGDPGRSSFFLSLEDDLMRIFGSDRLDSVLSRLGMKDGESIVHPWVNKSLERAQAKVEGHNFDIRKQLLKFDDVMNDQRKAIFEQRLEIMNATDLSETIKDMRNDVIEDLIDTHIPAGSYVEQWDAQGLQSKLAEQLGLELPITDWVGEDGVDDEILFERITKAGDEKAAKRVAEMGNDQLRNIEKRFLLGVIDQKWREHLVTLEHLRAVVGFRGYANRDPLNEFKTEAFELFEAMLSSLRGDVTQKLAHLRQVTPEEQMAMLQGQVEDALARGVDIEQLRKQMKDAYGINLKIGDPPPAGVDPEDPTTWPPLGRNDMCLCGSGKKYKHCCGKVG